MLEPERPVNPNIYNVVILIVLSLYTGFQRIYADQDILWSDRFVSGVPVVRLLAIQAGDDTQRYTGHGGIHQSDRFTHHLSNNGITLQYYII